MRILLISLATILAILISGCRHEELNPELIDPIYNDLARELGATESVQEDSEKKIAGLEKDLEKAAPRTIERRNAEEDLQKEQDRLEKITEAVEYLKLRLARRKVEARRDYKLAFLNDKPWPDPKEYGAYLVNKRLVHASKNWSDHVPKLSSEHPTAPVPESPAKSEGEGGTEEGGSHGGTKEGIHHN